MECAAASRKVSSVACVVNSGSALLLIVWGQCQSVWRARAWLHDTWHMWRVALAQACCHSWRHIVIEALTQSRGLDVVMIVAGEGLVSGYNCP